MKRLNFLLISWLCVMSTLGSVPKPKTPAPEADTPDVLLIHNSNAGELPAGMVVGNNVMDLLGHFHLKGKLISLEQYKPGDLRHYDFLIYLGVDDREVQFPLALRHDIGAARIPVLWVYQNFDDLLKEPQVKSEVGFGVGPQPVLKGFDRVLYKDVELPRYDGFAVPIQVNDPGRVQILAQMLKGRKETTPYFVHSGRFWYCAESPFAYCEEGDRYLVFCDVLHDFFGQPHPTSRKALLRIEDVCADDDPDGLIQLADYLASRNVPFQVSLIPIYRNPGKDSEIYLSDRPRFVRALQHMISRGATIVMHGVTHQYRGISGDDFELWDAMAGHAISGDSSELVEKKLRAGLEECFKNRIYPVTWETPHYMASDQDFRTLAKYFNSAYERIPSLPNAQSAHFLPYTTFDRFGRFIIPECLGYVSAEDPEPQKIVRAAAGMTTVRDGVASFFFHPFMDLKYLTEILDGLEGLGYRFGSIRDYSLKVQMDQRLVQTYPETIHLDIRSQYLHRCYVEPDGDVTKESYRRLTKPTTINDRGLVPNDAILVMEGVDEVPNPQVEPPAPSFTERLTQWIRRQLPEDPEVLAITGQPHGLILTEKGLSREEQNDESSFVNVFGLYGFEVTTQTADNATSSAFKQADVVIVPAASARRLSSATIAALRDYVSGGGNLVTEAGSPLLQAVGIKSEPRLVHVRSASDLLYREEKMRWNPPLSVVRFRGSQNVTPYVQDDDSEIPLISLTRFGHGRVLLLGTQLDTASTLGYSRFPYFIHYVLEAFDLKLPCSSSRLEMYFDPGVASRQAVDIERLAALWHKAGIRAIYAAAFHFYPTWSYDYKHLIEVCHRNNIGVYAWLEIPHVSRKFWEEHPEWHSKTAGGQEGIVGWRNHVDLDNPACEQAVIQFVTGLLTDADWDGVNLAELNYESDGPTHPNTYLPMTDWVRADFAKTAGFDPQQLFEPTSPYYWQINRAAYRKFEAYRVDRVVEWHRQFLSAITPLAKKRGFEVMVTMLDSLHSRTLTEKTGVDSKRIVALMREFPFTLQVEDPAEFWAGAPDRYLSFGETYRKLVPDTRRLMFDINVVPDRSIQGSHAPTPRATGIELAQSVMAAVKAAGRVAVYSESTVDFPDLETLSRVLVADARVDKGWNQWTTEAKEPIQMSLPGQWLQLTIDGEIWPGWGETEVLIPAGRHTIAAARQRFRWVDTTVLDTRLVGFNGDLLNLRTTAKGLEFSYQSNPPALALLNRRPFEVVVDDKPYPLEPSHYGGRWAIRLPGGNHLVQIAADSTAYLVLDTASVYSSSLIVIFGTVSCSLMVLVYLSILARRAVRRAVGRKTARSKTVAA